MAQYVDVQAYRVTGWEEDGTPILNIPEEADKTNEGLATITVNLDAVKGFIHSDGSMIFEMDGKQWAVELFGRHGSEQFWNAIGRSYSPFIMLQPPCQPQGVRGIFVHRDEIAQIELVSFADDSVSQCLEAEVTLRSNRREPIRVTHKDSIEILQSLCGDIYTPRDSYVTAGYAAKQRRREKEKRLLTEEGKGGVQ